MPTNSPENCLKKYYTRPICPVLCYFNSHKLFYKEYPPCKCVKNEWKLFIIFDDLNSLQTYGYIRSWDNIGLGDFQYFVEFYDTQRTVATISNGFERSQSLEPSTRAVTFSTKFEEKQSISFKFKHLIYKIFKDRCEQ